MKIFSTHQSKRHQLASWAAAALCVILSTSASAQSGLPGTGTAAQSSNPVQNGLFLHGDDSFRVVNTGFRTAADIGQTESGAVRQVGLFNQCGSCGTACGGSCGGSSSCGSCGTSCGGSCGNSRYLNPCAPCIPYRYVLIEGLYMERDGERNFTSSPNFGMNGFDFEFGTRITMGTVPDCVHGFEVSYTGPFDWDMSGQIAGTANIGTFLTAGLPVAAANLNTFSNADFQRQTYSAEYWSLEANKTLHGWEMAKLLVGGRYINYEEEYNYFSSNASGAGLLRSQVDNQLFGIQVGMDLLYPICKHGYSDMRLRVGGFINSGDSDFRVFNAGNNVVSNFDNDEEIAGLIEFGSGIRYQVGEMLSLRAGAEMWYLAGIATAPDQFRATITPVSGRNIRMDDDVFFTGATFGAELKY
ncbi:MAG: hypothetical protein AB8B91_14470 [Rubripirellula sp.]